MTGLRSSSSPGPTTAVPAVPTVAPPLGPTTSPLVTASLPAATVDALQAVLAGEHAVCWAYGSLGPHLGDEDEGRARSLLVGHQFVRDAVRAQVVGAGAEPVVAQPAYDLPIVPIDPGTAAALANLVESRLAAVYGDLVAGTSDAKLRAQGADGLTECVLRAQSWGTTATTFPGLPERA